jgi:regulator of replication initiation timing
MENSQFTQAPKRTTPLDKLQAYILKLEDKVITLTEENRDLKVELKALRKNKK